MVFEKQGNALCIRRQAEQLLIEPWGKNAFRLRGTKSFAFTGNTWALTEPLSEEDRQAVIQTQGDESAEIANGRLTIRSNGAGVLTFLKDGKPFLWEYFRNYFGTGSEESCALKVSAREYKPIIGGDYSLRVRFEGNDAEKIFGMGQYQQPYLNLKGCLLELAQRNSQVSVPFALSSLGYGFLWNNPAVGSAFFGKNYTEWQAEASKEIDYWITIGDTPGEILANYTAVTGRAPHMPENLLGLWQCKLRYRTQEEVLSVARKYKELGIPLDVIVIDFFHWTRQGDWHFDPEYWPDPKAMCDELHAMGTKVMVSVWPTVDRKSENFRELYEKGLLVRAEHGSPQCFDFQGDCVHLDATNPAAREFLWEKCKENYLSYGIDMFWLDVAEPEFGAYDFENYRYYLGPALETTNLYPKCYTRTFYEGQLAEGKKENIVSLVRCGWAGSQKYAALIWSGDIPSTFTSLRDQIHAGLNMGLAGIPWWTTDIGGFMTEDSRTPEFRELLLRWFEFAVFSPILRMHGDRGPYDIPTLSDKDFGGGYLRTGQPNELWSYGEEAFAIMKAQLDLRLSLKEYIATLMEEASATGAPLLRTMFYEFPEDKKCWEIDEQYMFGSRYLVAPVLAAGVRSRKVYLPEGNWKNIRDNQILEGGREIMAEAPLEQIPVFERM